MDGDIKLYIKTYREASLLQSLLILDKPWVSISMNFIVRFLKVDGINTVMVVINRFTNYVVFVVTSIVCTIKIVVGLLY
jgi:hypothetical protein